MANVAKTQVNSINLSHCTMSNILHIIFIFLPSSEITNFHQEATEKAPFKRDEIELPEAEIQKNETMKQEMDT